MLQVYTYEVRPKGIIITGFSQVRIKGIAGGRGLGVVCEHMNHFCYHTKEIRILNAWGASMLKESTAIVATVHQNSPDVLKQIGEQ